MKKERIKSAVLTVLVISSLLLTGQIWFNQRLWPEGYNFFVNIRPRPMKRSPAFLARLPLRNTGRRVYWSQLHWRHTRSRI